MWKSIKQHPWRLEIVPAVAFAWVLWTAYAFWSQELHSAIVPVVTGQVRRDLAQTAAWLIGFGLTFWVFSMGTNAHWVRAERGKSYNWLVVPWHAIILMKVFLAYGFLSLMYSNWFDPPTFLRLDLFAGGILLGTAVTAVLEWTRRGTPQDDKPEPPASVPNDGCVGLRYRETEVDWWPIAASASVLATLVVLVLLRMPVALAAVGLLMCAAFLLFGFRTVMLNSSALSVWIGLIRKRFPISDIESCKVAHHPFFPLKRDKRLRGIAITDGRCVELRMSDGRIRRIGAIRPSHICDLLALQGVTRIETPLEV
jgi:hypothetical protein